MAAEKTRQGSYRASADIHFPKVEQFLEPILASIATHDIDVARHGEIHTITSPFGVAELSVQPGRLQVAVETESRIALNRLKLAVIGPISFIAASENLDIHWTGDETGFTPLEDLRILAVSAVSELTPHMRRIVFTGDDLGHFARNDQLHCRLIFQPKDVLSPPWPMIDDRGHIVWPHEQKLDTRVYTIRAIDTVLNTLTIDFATGHKAGPATQWALAASPGDVVGIVGPAAGGPKAAKFYVLAGDETGLPGIARIIEGLHEDAEGYAFIEVAGVLEIQQLIHPSGVQLNWLLRDGAAAGTTTLLPDAVRSVNWPADLNDVFFWGGCEHKAFRAIHQIVRRDIKLPRANQVLYSHWHRSLSEEQIIAIGADAYLAE